MNLKQLEAFVCVAECKSFSRAAGKLYLTQPTVSAHIRALEKELNVTLFLRTTKEVSLSPDGCLLYEKARKMLNLEQEIRSIFSMGKGQAAEKILAAASTIPGQYVLPQIIPEFCRQFPNIQFRLAESDSEGVIHMVSREQVEIGFTGCKTEDNNCVFEPFFDDELVVITPAAEHYRPFLSSGFPLEQLYQESVIFREEGSGTRKETELWLEKEKIDIRRLQIVADMDNQEAIKKSVSNGMGVSILSAAAAQDYVEQGKLYRFEIKPGGMFRKLYLVWNRNHKPGPGAKIFLQFVRETCANQKEAKEAIYRQNL